MTINEEQIEQKKRIDSVIGIVLASAFGLALNLIANLYYDLFVTHSIAWADVYHVQVFAIGLIAVAVIGFLDFFIHDYKNDLEVNRSLWKRYSNYFFYEFKPGRILRRIFGIYMLMILISMLILCYTLMYQALGFLPATGLMSVLIVLAYLKDKKTRGL